METPLETHVADVLRAYGVQQSACVLGVSGGVDSISLLHCCKRLADHLALTLHVVHVNYGLRGTSSDADEAHVRSVCEAYGIPVHVVSARPYDEEMLAERGLEATAREIRYRAFVAYAELHDIRFVLTGHTIDDQAETVLMHLARGSGLTGLSGIPIARPLSQSVTVIRPLRKLQRSAVVDYARLNNLQWMDDATNETDTFQRNRVRHGVMPALREALGGHVAMAIDRSSEHLRNISSYIDEIVAQAARHTLDVQDTMIIVDVHLLQQYHPALVAEVLRTGLDLSFDDVQRVMPLMTAEVGSVAPIHGHRRVVRERATLVVMPESDDVLPSEVVINGDGQYVAGSFVMHVATQRVEDVTLLGGPSHAYIDAASVHGQLVWRPWNNGDRIQPFGMNGHVLVSDLLTNAQIPHYLRRGIRVLADDEGIIWVCGVRQAERTRVTNATSTVYVLHSELPHTRL